MTGNAPPKKFADPVVIDEPWASAFRSSGMVNPNTGEPSIQALHRESGLHPSAISRIITGRVKRPRPQTVMKMSEALSVSFVEVAKWVGQNWTEYEPWTPPATSHLMTNAQRDIVEALIREFTRSGTPENQT